MPRTSWSDVAGFGIVLPPDTVVGALNRLMRPIIERIYANVEFARTLAQTRDTLLPRLVSGKLRLPDMQEQAEEVCV